MKLFYVVVFLTCTTTVQAQTIQLVKDINIGGAFNEYYNSDISSVTPIGSKTYFTADDGTSGREPWVTDGTASGTFMLRDINPGLLPSITSNNLKIDLSRLAGGVYFVKLMDGALLKFVK